MAAGGNCSDCGALRRFLHSHHIIPRSHGGSDEPDNLALICGNCHEDRHYGVYGGPALSRTRSHTPEAQRKRSESLRKAWAEGRFDSRRERNPEGEARRIAATREAMALRSTKERMEISARGGVTKRATHAKRNAARNAQIVELREAGMIHKDIAELVGCSISTVQYTLKLMAEGAI